MGCSFDVARLAVFGALVKPVQGFFNLCQCQFIFAASEVASLKALQAVAADLQQVFHEDAVHAVFSHRAFLEFHQGIHSAFSPVFGMVDIDHVIFMARAARAGFIQAPYLCESVLSCFEYVHSIPLCAYATVGPLVTKRR